MTRQYDDDAEEAASIIAWTERRLAVSTSAGMVAIYGREFKRMWRESFGTLDNVPQTFKDRVTAQFQSFKKEAKLPRHPEYFAEPAGREFGGPEDGYDKEAEV